MLIEVDVTSEEIEQLKSINWIEVWSSKYGDCDEPVARMIDAVIAAYDSEGGK